MMKVAVFHKDTGIIRQIVTCREIDADRQHQAFPDHDYVDITDQHPAPHPERHAIHPVTKRLIIKPPTPFDPVAAKEKKRGALEQACRATLQAAMVDTAVDDWMAFRAFTLSKYAGLLSAVDSASDAAGLDAIVWG
jgi:hypothetical protein